MFLLRSAFWLTIVIMLIPADPESGEAPRVTVAEAMGALRDTVTDLSGFCDRNPDVCVTGGAAAQMIAEKSQNGIEIVYRYVTGEESGGIDMAPGAPGAPSGIDMAPGAHGAPAGKGPRRGTLTTDDLALPWQGDLDDPA